MGNDFYNPPSKTSSLPQNFCIGESTLIQNAIVDKHTCIGNNVQLINKNALNHYDSKDIYIRDGIIVVPRGVTIPDGFIL